MCGATIWVPFSGHLSYSLAMVLEGKAFELYVSSTELALKVCMVGNDSGCCFEMVLGPWFTR